MNMTDHKAESVPAEAGHRSSIIFFVAGGSSSREGISFGQIPSANSTACSSPGGDELPPPLRRPLLLLAVIALRLFRLFDATGVGHTTPSFDVGDGLE